MQALLRAAALAATTAVCACGVSHGPPPSNPAPAPRAIAAFAMPAVVAPPPPPPFALTTSDGTPLRLASIEARTQVRGPLASTELRMRFVNETSQIVEGRFRIVLPQRSFVSRLAMKIDGRLREADVVELPIARTVYEDTMHVRRDPLLVEQKNDNELTARVFPIPANGDKEIVVGWVSEIDASTPITIPLRGAERLDDLDVRVTDGDKTLFAEKEHDVTPSDDVRVPAPNGASSLRAGDTIVARVRVSADPMPDPIGRGLLVLLDTSASRAAELDATLAMLREVTSSIAREEPEAHLVVAAFDQDVSVVHDGSIGGFDVARVRARGALGASDLGAALAWAAKRNDVSRLLIVGDGLATAGDASRENLREAAARISVPRIDAIAVGDVRDDALLRTLARNGVVLSGSIDASRLRKKSVDGIAVSVPGARWFSPRTLDGVEDGDERFVYAEGDASRVIVGGRTSTIVPAWSPIADRAVAKAKIDVLSLDETKQDEVIAIARKNKLASPLTAMIVLENEAARSAMEARRVVRVEKKPSSGVIVSRHVTKAPLLRMGTTTVNGRLPPEVIQRIVRRNWGRFRGCYLEGFIRNAQLSGRITTKIVLAPDGSVVRAEDAGSDLPDAKVVACVVESFRSLTFPSHDTGWITITYPITFRPLENGEEEQAAAPQHLAAHSPRGAFTSAMNGYEPPPYVPPPAWTGAYAFFRRTLDDAGPDAALAVAAGSHARDLRDASTLLALGDALAISGYRAEAARAYGSLADLEPHRADRLRAASARLASVDALPLAIELARRAAADRLDVPSSHELLAMTLLQAARYEEAFEVLVHAGTLSYAPRMGEPKNVFVDLMGLVATAWRAAEPARADEIDRRATLASVTLPATSHTRFVLTWETDPSRLHLHVANAEGREIAQTNGWTTQGWGPVATMVAEVPEGATASIGIDAMPPSGEPTMGVVHVVKHDGQGHVTVEPRPFVIMSGYGRVPLGAIAPTSSGSRAQSPSSRDGS